VLFVLLDYLGGGGKIISLSLKKWSEGALAPLPPTITPVIVIDKNICIFLKPSVKLLFAVPLNQMDNVGVLRFFSCFCLSQRTTN
jgi:hypothetical protein